MLEAMGGQGDLDKALPGNLDTLGSLGLEALIGDVSGEIPKLVFQRHSFTFDTLGVPTLATVEESLDAPLTAKQQHARRIMLLSEEKRHFGFICYLSRSFADCKEGYAC